MYKRLSERLPDVFLKKLDVSEQRILYLKQTDFDDKQQDDKNTYSLELFIIGAVNHTRHIAFLQFGNIIIQCSFRIAGIIHECTDPCLPGQVPCTSAHSGRSLQCCPHCPSDKSRRP